VASEGPPTILFEIFWTNQKRTQLIDAALQGTALPPEDYPIYVMVGAEGPWTPTGLAKRLEMPLTTLLFRVQRLEKRGHAERIGNPNDRRSFLIRLTPEGTRLLRRARPAFRSYAEAVDARLGADRVARLKAELVELRQAIDAELTARSQAHSA
jgi:DNA-binding MarR family transcriptional regulator